MAKFIWGLLCSRVIVDKASNSVSYIDAIEQMTAASLPAGAPLIVACALWERDRDGPYAITVRARVEDPKGRTVFADEVRADLLAHFVRTRTHLGLAGYIIETPGRYEVVLEQVTETEEGAREYARLPFVITLADARAEPEMEPVAVGRLTARGP